MHEQLPDELDLVGRFRLNTGLLVDGYGADIVI